MTSRANPVRGEAAFVIEGTEYRLRPSFESLVAAEEEIGSLFAIVEKASEGGLTAHQMSSLIWHCLPASERPSREAVGQALMAMGLVAATTPVRAILAQVLQGRR